MYHIINNALDENVLEHLNEIVVNKLEDEDEQSGIFNPGNMKSKIVCVSQKKSKSTEKIINSVIPLFERVGMKVNPNNGYIRYESYTYNDPNFIDTPYDISDISDISDTDCSFSNYYDTYDTCCVCYLITRKDQNLKGGNMYLYKEHPSFLQTIGYEKEENVKVNLEKGTAFFTNGNTLHKLAGCSGTGIFSFICIVLPKQISNE